MADSQRPASLAPSLLRAYQATEYRVGGIGVRIGRRSRGMDGVLTRLHARCGGLVTAWNPMSRLMPDGWNRRMQHRLQDRLRRHATLPASGSWRGWREEHLLAAADPRVILRIARLFRQRGVVLVARHRPARLALLGGQGERAKARRAAGHPSWPSDCGDEA